MDRLLKAQRSLLGLYGLSESKSHTLAKCHYLAAAILHSDQPMFVRHIAATNTTI